MPTVYVVQHSYELDDEASSEETKFIGVYSSRVEAEKAVERLRKQPGFSALPDYFYVNEYELDHDNWSEGFVTEQTISTYSVWSTDNAGTIVLVKDGLVKADALRLVRDLQRRDHSKKFWARING